MNNIILYGAGKQGGACLQFLETQGFKDLVYAFCDSNANEMGSKHMKNVLSYEAAKKLNIPFVISVVKTTKGYYEIEEKLEKDNVEYYENISDYAVKILKLNRAKFNRDYCAYYHITDMDEYFDEAESYGSLNIFWDKDSTFYNFFQLLDLSSVVELACGRGRHVPKYSDKAGKIMLVDILDKNIEYVKNRFENISNIYYYKNNGYDLSELSSDSYTALFTYDAMVHFELFDVYSYLQEAYRILVPGGLALFHHSNNNQDYKNSFYSNTLPGNRNFMDKKLFAYLAYRAGFKIVEQKVIDWNVPSLDCISLVQKM